MSSSLCGLWAEGLVWLIGVVVCLLATNRGSSCSLMWAMDGCILCYGIISSCQSADKALLVTDSDESAGVLKSAFAVS